MNTPKSINILYLILLFLFTFSGFFIPNFLLDDFYFTTFFSQVGLLFIPIVLYSLFKRIPIKHIIPIKKIKLRDLAFIPFITISLVFVGNYLNAITIWLFSSLLGPLYQPSFPISQSNSFWIYIISMAVLPALLEEIFSRGFIINAYQSYGHGASIIISALLFAFLHLSFINFLNTFLLGIFFGYLVINTESIFSGMLGHFVYNAFIVTTQYYGNLPTPTDYISLSFSELVMMLPGTLVFLVIGLAFFHLYKKGTQNRIESLNNIKISFFHLLNENRLIYFIFLLAIIGNMATMLL